MSTHGVQRHARWIAGELGLEHVGGSIWSGRVDGLKVQIQALHDMTDCAEGARIAVELPVALRLGRIACTGPDVTPLDRLEALPIGHRVLDSFLVLGAVEPEVAQVSGPARVRQSRDGARAVTSARRSGE